MYKKGLFFSLVLLLLSLILSAQSTVTVNGIVKDSVGNPVVAVSVTIINESGSGIDFAKTNQQGLFTFKFTSTTEKLSIKTTCLGYQQNIVSITQTSNETYVIILKKALNQLKEVTIKSNSKISLSSDTLKYNVSAFRDQNDRVIADLIKKLPGLQIDEKGTISYNGKRITNVYIDGDNLLDGKYGIATKNVPVGAVDQVQVIERDQPIKALNGYVATNNVSLNLKLTDSARTISINTGHVGVGNKAYSAELNNLIFKKKVKSINNLKANNVGQDLLGENANVGMSFNNNEVNLKTSQPYLSMEAGEQPTLSDKYYLMNNDNAGNINVLFKLRSDWGLRLNLSSLRLKRKYNYSNFVNYFLPSADTIAYRELQNNVYKLNQWQFQGQIEKNSSSVYLKSITKLEIPKWGRTGNTSQNGLDFSQNQPSSYLSLSNETNVVEALGKDDILQYNSVVQYYKMDERLKILPGLQEAIVNDSIGYLMLDQQVKTKNIFINQSASYKLKFNRFIFSTSLGISFERNKLNSNLYKTDSTNNIQVVGGRFKNDVNFNHLSLFGKASLIYLLQKGSLSVETSPSYDFINYAPAGGNAIKNKYFLINPIIEFRKNISKYGELNFRFSQQTEFGQVNEIYPGTILVNYRQFNFNETPLPKTDITSLSARYSYRKPLKMLFYNLNFSYDRTKQNFINSYTIDSGLTKSIAIDFKNKMDKYTINGNISKYIFFVETNLSANGSLGLKKGYSFYNNEIAPFNAYDFTLGITARKKIFNAATISVTGEMRKLINKQNILQNTEIKNETKVEKLRAEWLHNLNNQVSYTLSYNFTSYQQLLQQPVCNNFLDINVKYAPSKWKSYFEFQCINLVNQNLYQQINSNSNQLSVFQIPLRERTFLLKYFFTF